MDELVERLRVIIVAGIATGAVVVGGGGRLAMLLLRLTSPDGVRGIESDDGFVIGQVTLAGTYNLMMLGAVVGLIGAIAYLAVAPWLIGPSWFRRGTVAAASGVVVGSMLIHADGVDFTVLEPTWLAIAVFVALPAAFGAAIGVVVDRVAAPSSWTAQGRRRWVLPIVAIACFPFTAFVGLVFVPLGLVVLVLLDALHQMTASHAVAGLAVRGVWLAIAVAGLAALVQDVDAIVQAKGMDELFDDGDATSIAAAVAKGEVSAREVVAFALARIDERNPSLNAVVARRDAEALAEATAIDADASARGPLAGVPIVIKDLGATVAGMPATGGSRLFADVIATEDSEMVRRYRRAGAVIVGMTNTPELGRNGSTEPLLFGPARNPYGLSHSTGGSSGGTAAAVAAGMVPAGHANDGGGSIRIPASACGLIGLKPSRGRTPAAPKHNAMSYPMAVNHALTRTVRDSALLLDVTQGAMVGDPYVIGAPSRPYVDEVGADPGQCRVAVSTTTPAGDHIDPDCADAVARAVARLTDLGHDVREGAPDYPLDALQMAMRVFMAAPLAVDIDARLAELGRPLRDDDLEPMTRMIYEGAAHLRGTDVVIAHQELERAARTVGEFFADHDLLVTATIARTVPPLGLLDTTNIAAMQRHAAIVAALTSPFNVTGQPALSLPFGVDRHGLPVGVQFVAAFGREDLLLRVAGQLEAAGAWDHRPAWPPRD